MEDRQPRNRRQLTAELRQRGWRVNHKRWSADGRHGIVGHRQRRRRSGGRPPDGSAGYRQDVDPRRVQARPGASWAMRTCTLDVDRRSLSTSLGVELESAARAVSEGLAQVVAGSVDHRVQPPGNMSITSGAPPGPRIWKRLTPGAMACPLPSAGGRGLR